jgi:hypothetical protein
MTLDVHATESESAADLLASFNVLLGQQFDSLAQAVDAARNRQTELDTALLKGELECEFELRMVEGLLEKYLDSWTAPAWQQ